MNDAPVTNSLFQKLYLDGRNALGLAPQPQEQMGLLGVDAYDARDYIKDPADGRPEPINLLRKYRPDLKAPDQKRTNRCTGFAGANALSIMTGKLERLTNAPPSNTLYSANDLYYQIRGDKTRDSGAYMRDLMKALYKTGAVSERVWPGTANLFRRPKELDNNPRFSTTGYERIMLNSDTTARMKQVLSVEELPILIGASLYQRSSVQAQTYGVFEVPSDKDTPSGAHAMTVCGWRQGQSGSEFILLNSWGSNTGDGGIYYLPEAYITAGLVFDIWTLPAITF